MGLPSEKNGAALDDKTKLGLLAGGLAIGATLAWFMLRSKGESPPKQLKKTEKPVHKSEGKKETKREKTEKSVFVFQPN